MKISRFTVLCHVRVCGYLSYFGAHVPWVNYYVFGYNANFGDLTIWIREDYSFLANF